MRVVLVEPEIPPNTGNIGRLCAATGTPLDLVGPLGFNLSDRHLKRAGLDYWPFLDLHRHVSWERFLQVRPPGRLVLASSKAPADYTDFHFEPDDQLVFGPESRGLPEAWLSQYPSICIPHRPEVRSLNLATAVAIILFEALRQQKSGP